MSNDGTDTALPAPPPKVGKSVTDSHGCEGNTPSGKPCQAPVLAGSRFCWSHDPANEKAADAARSIGLDAVTSAHGSSAPAKSSWAPLAGRDVVILPDADEPGAKYAREVAMLLARLEPPARAKMSRSLATVVPFIARSKTR